MIRTTKEIEQEKEFEFYDLVKKLGNFIEFKKPIRFRETPHTPTQKIYGVSINDNFKNYGLAQDTIIQQLKWDYFQKYKKKYKK